MTILILSIVILLVASAFFSGSETALTGVSRAKIHKLKREGNKKAIAVSNLREDKDRLIGAILLGNNAVNIAASALATSAAISYFGGDGVFYATVIMTLLVLIFAEVLPKTYAFRNAERVALIVSPVFSVIVKILSPVTIAVQFVVDSAMRLFGVRNLDDKEVEGTDALRGAIELHHDAGAVVKDDRDMLDSILDLTETEVGEVMIHRKKMEIIDSSESNEKIVELVSNSSHTRIPFWKDNPDNIIGVLHSKDLMRALQDVSGEADKLDIKSIIKEPWFVPETTTLNDQLQAFREKHHHFALVVDEYGALLGLVTLEDILEEIVGQIEDEYDPQKKVIRENVDESYTVDGAITVRDLNRELGWNLPDDIASTIAGLIINEAKLIPEIGQVFHFHGCRFKVLRKQRNQITSVRVSRFEDEENI